MPDSSSNAPAETYAIEYEGGGAEGFNAELKGAGTLTLDAARGLAVFTGVQRRMFGTPSRREVAFRDMANVRLRDRAVAFDLRPARPGGKRRPFVFFCGSAEVAETVARRLPAALEAEFVEGQDFAARLQQVPGAAAWWQSPTHAIIAANVAAFVAMGFLGAGWFEAGDLSVYVRYGANNGAATTNGEWWRLVTSMFLHYGLLHLLFNMWALFQIGALLEKLLGRVGFVVAYFGSGIAGSLATLLWNGDKVWSAGASGAVFGVYGMLGGYVLRERHAVPRSVVRPLVKSTLWFAGYNLLFGLVHPGIDNAAHIGGMSSGVLLGTLMALPLDLERRAQLRGRRLVAGLLTIGVLGAAGVASAPRFDYTIAEELAWDAAIKTPLANEAGVLERQETLVNEFRATGNGAALVRWIGEEAVPFYEAWERDLTALALTSGSKTERRRAGLEELLRTKLSNYRQLAADVRAGNPDAISRYERAEAEMIGRARAASPK